MCSARHSFGFRCFPPLDSCSAAPVQGLYCKRPIQCLASSKLLPHPLTARRVCTPHLWCGGRTQTLGGEGVGGGSIFWKTPDTALYSTFVSTLCMAAPLSCSGPLHLAQQVYFSQLCQQDHAWHQRFYIGH
jgi:hypothetical protein